MPLTLRSVLFVTLLLLASFAFSLSIVHAQSNNSITNSNNAANNSVTNPKDATNNSITNPNTADNNSITNPSQGSGVPTLTNPLNNISDLPTLLNVILQAVVELGSIVLTVMLVWVGFLFVTAQGNPEKLTTARSALIWTVIGGLILLGAEAISQVIQATAKSL